MILLYRCITLKKSHFGIKAIYSIKKKISVNLNDDILTLAFSNRN